MLWAMMLGFIGILILLSFQFRAYTEPIIVMLAIPCMYLVLGDPGIVEKITVGSGGSFEAKGEGG
ncbi:MAG: hypothetical protein ACOC8I_04610 [Desulfosalsimonas sp.]